MVSYQYIPTGICSSMIRVFIDETTDTLKSISILGGCHGNLTAIMKLVKGKKVQEVIDMFQGIKCGRRDTSCPDQIAQALRTYVDEFRNLSSEKLS